MQGYLEIYRSYVKNIKTNGTQANGLCPFHEDKNPSFSFNIENGNWKCFAGCGEGGFKTFQSKIRGDNRPLKAPSEPKVKKNGSIIPKRYKDMATNAVQHMLDNTKKDIGSMPWDKKIVKKLNVGYDPDHERFVFPIMRNKKYNHVKFHKDLDGKVFQVGASGNKIYPEEVFSRIPGDQTLYIVEGEKDVVTMLSNGLHAICFTAGSGSIPEDISKLKDFSKINIVFDNDDAGREGAMKLARAVVGQDGGVKLNVYTFGEDFPEGFDITDYFQGGGTAEDFVGFVERGRVFGEDPSDFGGFNVLTTAEFIDAQWKEPGFVVREILEEQGTGCIAGTDNIGKSFLATQFAICVALGIPFLNYAVPNPRNVLLLQFEMQNGEVSKRVSNMSRYFNEIGVPGDMNNLSIVPFQPDTGIFEDNWERIDITLEYAKQKFDVLVVDNMYTSTGVDVSDNKHLMPLLGTISRIKNKYELSVMLVNHHNKTHGQFISLNKEMIRGGKTFTDWLSNVVQIADSELVDDMRVFKVTKVRSGNSDTRMVAQGIMWDNDNLIFKDRTVLPNKEEVYYADPKESLEIKLWKQICSYAGVGKDVKSNEFSRGQFAVIMEELGFEGPASVTRYLTRLVNLNLIERGKTGQFFVVNNAILAKEL